MALLGSFWNDTTPECSSVGPNNNYSDTPMSNGQKHYCPFEASNFNAAENSGYYGKHDDPCAYKFQLEKDVQSLHQQLQEEKELHSTLEDAIENKFVELTKSRFHQHTIQLLSSIATIEATVSELEEEITILQYQLSQERNERRLAEYRLLRTYSETTASSSSKDNKTFLEKHAESCVPGNVEKLTREVSSKDLWNHPNWLSEEMVCCMRSIFISLAQSAPESKLPVIDSESSPHISNTQSRSLSEHLMVPMLMKSPQIDFPHDSEVLGTENDFDPYKISGKLSWVDIGRYGLATEVSWVSVGKRQLEYAAGSLRRFRILVEQLAKVNPIELSCDEKLAFWINLYNALIMHAYLAYGVPRSELKFFSLLRKVAYTVGGHLFSAAIMEYVILKMRPPTYRPQIALLLPLHKLKISEEQKKFSIDSYKPSDAFALSCGMYSSPAVEASANSTIATKSEVNHKCIPTSKISPGVALMACNLTTQTLPPQTANCVLLLYLA